MEENSLSARCKACDVLFSSRWYKDRKQWEDLCPKCLYYALGGVDYEEDHDYATEKETFQRTEGAYNYGDYE